MDEITKRVYQAIALGGSSPILIYEATGIPWQTAKEEAEVLINLGLVKRVSRRLKVIKTLPPLASLPDTVQSV